MADERDTPLYMIGILAQMLSIHPQTLRLYEREGLLHQKDHREIHGFIPTEMLRKSN